MQALRKVHTAFMSGFHRTVGYFVLLIVPLAIKWKWEKLTLNTRGDRKYQHSLVLWYFWLKVLYWYVAHFDMLPRFCTILFTLFCFHNFFYPNLTFRVLFKDIQIVVFQWLFITAMLQDLLGNLFSNINNFLCQFGLRHWKSCDVLEAFCG